MSAVSRILVLAGSGLGDALLIRPALAGLRRAHPDASIQVAGPARYAALIADVVDATLTVDASTTKGLADLAHLPEAQSPDLAVNLHGPGPQSHLALAMLRPARLIAFRQPPVHFDGPPWRDREHEAERWMRLVDSALGIPCSLDALALPPDLVAGARRHGAVVVHPASEGPGTRWPSASFARACRMLAERGYRVLVVGTAAERRLVDVVGGWGDVPPEDRLAGRTDVGSFVRLLSGAALVVTGNSGVGQLAEVVGTPTVRLISSQTDRTPLSGPHTVLRSQRLDNLEPATVVNACLARLDGTADSRPQVRSVAR